MKNRICLLFLFAVFPSFALAQNPPSVTRTFNLTSTDTKGPSATPWISLRGSGINSHQIMWSTKGTVSTCSVKVEQSEDGSSWSDLIAGATCTSNNTGTQTSGVANYVRVNATTFTGSGTLTVTYFGYSPLTAPAASSSLGTVAISQSGSDNAVTFAAPQHVVVDSGGGGGTQYTEDAAAAADPVGTVPILVRKDIPGPTVSTDGDNIAQHGSNFGAAYVTSIDSLGNFMTSAAGSGLTNGVQTIQGNASGTPVPSTVASATVPAMNMNSATASGGVTVANACTFDDTSPQAVTENNFGAMRCSANRNLYGTIRDAAGNERGLNVDASNGIAVSLESAQTLATVTTVSTVSAVTTLNAVVPGTGATNLGKAEDAVAASGDTGVAILGVIQASLTAPAADGDYTVPKLNANGAMWTQDVFRTAADAAEDAAVATSPVPVGCVFRTASVTLDNGDIGYLNCDVDNSLKVTGVLANNGIAAASNRVGVLPGISQSNMPSALTAGRDAALRQDLQGNLLTASVNQTSMTSFAASKVGLATAASATDIAVLSGNATNTVIVNRIVASCTQTTAGIIDLRLLKRTTADSGGTSTNSPTAYGLDSANASAVSAVLTYTANPTVNDGTDRVIDSAKIGALAPATAGANDVYVWNAPVGSQALILRGTAQQAALNLNGVTVSGSSCDVSYVWTETTGL